MIFINLDELLNLLNQRLKGEKEEAAIKTQERVTVSSIAEKTGITRKALSKIKNHPTKPISSKHLGELCEYFFHKFLPLKLPNRSEALLMEWVVSTLIQVYPDDKNYECDDKLALMYGNSAIKTSTAPPSFTWVAYALKKGIDPAMMSHRGRGEIYELLFGQTTEEHLTPVKQPPAPSTTKGKRKKN